MSHYENTGGLRKLASRVEKLAEYENREGYGHIPRGMDVDNRPWGSIAEAYAAMGKKKSSTIIALRALGDMDSAYKRIEEAVRSNTGFDSFSFLQQGNSAVAILASSETDFAVLRITLHPEHTLAQKSDTVRSAFPGLLQGRQAPIKIDDKVQVEVLPAVSIVDLGEGKKLFHRLIADLCEDTCYQADFNEAAILPDGTIMVLDPGECRYRDDFFDVDEQEQKAQIATSNALINQRLDDWGIPSVMQWTASNGSPKQDFYFPAIRKPGDDDMRGPSFDPLTL